ncbi:MAG: hypothetical protein QOC82_2450 [Frankiaceae bacterium]|nr:hypothetical protein [Frankiaceae bacterium]
MTTLDPDLVRKLAANSIPALFFSDKEAFYPIRAEAWLTHTTSAPWDTEVDPDDIGALDADPHHRGTCLLRASNSVTDHVRLAGPPNPDDSPLRVEASGAVDAIGNAAYAGAPDPAHELFLSFGGWAQPKEPYKGGDVDYVRAAFSELASAINHDVVWESLALQPNRPFFGTPQPVSPAVYCEVDWAGAHFREAPPAAGMTSSPLDHFLQVTYYYFFPARTPLAGQDVSTLEGQWAAVSLFYRVAGNLEDLDGDHRPKRLELRGEPRPEWVVLSLDPENWSCTPLRVSDGLIQIATGANGDEAHAGVWVGAGTHRFFVGQSAEVPTKPQEPWPSLDYEPGSDMEGLAPAVLPGMVGTAIAGDAGGVVATILAGGPIWWLIAWLINAITELWDDDESTADIPRSADSTVEPGGQVGNPAFGSSAPPDPNQPAPDGWATNDGSPDGWDVAYFDMKVLCRIAAARQGAPDLDPPPWWSYTGRWGIKVPPESSSWTSGTRRVDERGRSWAYWMASQVMTAIVNQTPGPAGP